MAKIIFLDTNIYLHYQSFDQINWFEILDVDVVTIIVPPVTIRELNKHKETHPQSKIKKRAGAIIKKLFELFETDSYFVFANGVGIKQEDREPSIDYDNYQLDRNIQDDNLIASALMSKEENPDTEIIIITSDYGLNLLGKARRLGIQSLRLPENFKLPEEPDAEQKRIHELKQELDAYKLKSPKLFLSFGKGNSHIKFELTNPAAITDDEIDHQLDQMRDDYPKMSEEQKNRIKDSSGLTSSVRLDAIMGDLHRVSHEDIVEYNNSLDRFYERYAEYIKQASQFRGLIVRTLKLDIWVVNDGTAPADDVDVFMHFPDGFNLMTEDNYPESPMQPTPPKPPMTQLQKITRPPLMDFSYSALHPTVSLPDIAPGNVSEVNIRRTNSYDVDFNIKRLKQKLQEPADTLYVVFESYEDANSFQIDYEILVAEPPYETSGKLHVVIDKK